jgi:hypothetical protein
MHQYPVGTPGKAWGPAEIAAWQARQSVKRSYKDEVLSKLELLKDRFDVEQYGALSYIDGARYPLFCVRSRKWEASRPTLLVTGGVHGYETSGVQGALLFMATKAEVYSGRFNILCAPCVSPWGYETIQRWNRNAEDPNRGFSPDSTREECAALMKLVASVGADKFTVHIDLHETTDTDESEFRPAKAARDGDAYTVGTIPDGFYLVGDSENPQHAWHKAMIDSVRNVTHIAPPDASGTILDMPLTQEGVIAVPVQSLFLCSSVTNAAYATTTEVYPDSPQASDEQCNLAQVACITAALDHILQQQS